MKRHARIAGAVWWTLVLAGIALTASGFPVWSRVTLPLVACALGWGARGTLDMRWFAKELHALRSLVRETPVADAKWRRQVVERLEALRRACW